MTRSGFRKRIYFSFLPSVAGSFCTHPRNRRRNSYETVLLSCGLLLYVIHSSPRSVTFSHHLSAFFRKISFVWMFSDVGNLPSSLLNPIEFAFVSMQVTGARCHFVRYDSSVFRSVYLCMSNGEYVDNYSWFSDTWLRKVCFACLPRYNDSRLVDIWRSLNTAWSAVYIYIYIHETVQMVLTIILALCPPYAGSFWVLSQVVGFIIYCTLHFALFSREFHVNRPAGFQGHIVAFSVVCSGFFPSISNGLVLRYFALVLWCYL
jgi:hypothetical protein